MDVQQLVVQNISDRTRISQNSKEVAQVHRKCENFFFNIVQVPFTKLKLRGTFEQVIKERKIIFYQNQTSQDEDESGMVFVLFLF